MNNDDRTYGTTDKDKDQGQDTQGQDTEGHDARRQFPAPPVVSGEDNWPQGFVGETGEGRAELDVEGHGSRDDSALPQRPGPGEALPQRPGPGEHLLDHDTEGHRAAPALPPHPGAGEALPQRPGPGEHIDGDADTEGHLLFRRRPGEAGE